MPQKVVRNPHCAEQLGVLDRQAPLQKLWARFPLSIPGAFFISWIECESMSTVSQAGNFDERIRLSLEFSMEEIHDPSNRAAL